MSLDGYCDHTLGHADDETHQHYTELIRSGGVLLYGRTTYQLMEDFWPTLLETPSGNPALDDFAAAITEIPKVVFSHTLDAARVRDNWKNARLATNDLVTEIEALKQEPGKDIFIGSPSLIAEATRLGLVDEFQLCIHTVIAGKGLVLFQGLEKQVNLKLTGTKTFACGAVIHYYQTKRD